MSQLEELQKLGEAVRDQGINKDKAKTKLVFDSATGEFKQVRIDAPTSEGDVVTLMSNEGFA